MGFDVVIASGTVIDGTGRPNIWSDSDACSAGIAFLITEGSSATPQTLDGADRVTVPGFIDAHWRSHSILPFFDHDLVLAPLLLHDITALVTDHCSISASIDRQDGLAQLLHLFQLTTRPISIGPCRSARLVAYLTPSIESVGDRGSWFRP